MYRDVTVDPAGHFHDCASPMNGIAPWLYIDGAAVVSPALTQSLLYPNISSNGAVSIVLGQGGGQGGSVSGTLLVTSRGVVSVLGNSFGQAPVITEWLPSLNQFVAFAVMHDGVGNALVRKFLLDAEGVVVGEEPYPMRPGGSSQGFADCVNGVPVWVDDEPPTHLGGYPFWLRMTRGIYTVGQSDPVQIAVWDGTQYLVASRAPSPLQPRIAISGAEVRIAVSFEPDIPLITQADLVPYVPPPIVYPVVGPFNHAVTVTVFKDPDGTSGAPSEVVIDGASQSVVRPCWAGFDLDGGSTSIDRAHAAGTLEGIFCEDHGPRGIEAARPKADQLKCRVAWLHDGSGGHIPVDLLHEWDEVWVLHYVAPGETLAAAEVRWVGDRAAAMDTHCVDLGIVPQFFGDRPDQETVDIIAAGLEPVNTSVRWKIPALFEYKRLNGITGRACIAEMYRRTLAASVLGPAHLVPAWPPPPPSHADPLLYSLFKESVMIATRVVGGPQLKAVPGGFAVILSSPTIDADYLGLPPKGTVLTGGPTSGPVALSIQPDGSFECRDPKAIAGYETGKPANGFLAYSPDGVARFLIPYSA